MTLDISWDVKINSGGSREDNVEGETIIEISCCNCHYREA